MNDLIQNRWCPGRDSNSAALEYKSKVLMLQAICSITVIFNIIFIFYLFLSQEFKYPLKISPDSSLFLQAYAE
jgi:hypothetical protein